MNPTRFVSRVVQVGGSYGVPPGAMRLLPRAFLCLLLSIHACLLLQCVHANFPVVDEVGHIPAGIHHWKTGRFKMYEVNPPLPRMLAVIPILFKAPTTEFRDVGEGAALRYEFKLGPAFAKANADRYISYVSLARLPGIAWSLLGALLIYRWSFELFGPIGAALSLATWCFEPLVLAFAPLVVPDVPAAVACLAATYTFWHYLQDSRWGRASYAGLFLGVAQLTKFTFLVLYIAWPLIWIIARLGTRWKPVPTVRPILYGGHALLMLVVSVVVINLGYGCEGSFHPLGEIQFVSRALAGPPPGPMPYLDGRWGNRFKDSWLGTLPVPFPLHYIQGIDVQRHLFEEGTLSYLAGRWQCPGWWYYYLYAICVKVPTGVLFLSLWSFCFSSYTP